MSDALTALRDGMRRVNRAPAILFGVWIVTVAAVALPAVVLGRTIARDLNDSLTADAVAAGTDDTWIREFAQRSGGLGATFGPAILGGGAVLENLSAIADATPRPAAITAVAAAYLVVWLFLAGGILDRYARDRATRAHGFFAACGVYFFRFLRLAVIQAIVYGTLFGVVHTWLFGSAYPRLVAQMTTERAAFTARVVLYLVFALMLAAANLVFDITKIRAVVEDRRSMMGALSQALGFLRRNGGITALLYALNVGLFVAAVVLYVMAAPEVGRGILVWGVVAMTQLFVNARIWLNLTFWASETSLYQMRLAHAGYVARPDAMWPESPAAEAISG
jgi:hypothetical protein